MFRAKALFFFTALTAAAQVTSIPSGVGGGAGVGGASNLTTVGAIPYVSAAGILNQTANLSFDVANNRFILGSATVQRFSTDLSLSRAAALILQVGDGGSNALGQLNARAVNAVSNLVAFNATGGIYMSGNAGSSWGTVQSYSDGNGTAKATAINPTGGNVLVGTTTDVNFKLDVATSDSAGTARFYDATPTTGSTKVVVRAGAGQSGNLQEWQNSAGSVVASVLYDGADLQGTFLGNGAYLALKSALASPYASLIFFKSSNTQTWRVGNSGSDSFQFLAGAAENSVASLTSAGTFTVYNQTPTTGVTKAVIRAGAGQSTTNLTEWQNASTGAVLASVSSSGRLAASGVSVGIGNFSQFRNIGVGYAGDNDIFFASSGVITYSNNATLGLGTADLGLSRSSAGLLEINNGTAGTYRDLILRRSQHNGVTVADLPTAAAGNAGSIQYVTDANATTIGSTVAGGGANKVMVWSDGAAWKIFAN